MSTITLSFHMPSVTLLASVELLSRGPHMQRALRRSHGHLTESAWQALAHALCHDETHGARSSQWSKRFEGQVLTCGQFFLWEQWLCSLQNPIVPWGETFNKAMNKPSYFFVLIKPPNFFVLIEQRIVQSLEHNGQPQLVGRRKNSRTKQRKITKNGRPKTPLIPRGLPGRKKAEPHIWS